MFSFRRKSKKPEVPQIRTSPSLPELHNQGIPWPENLIDAAAVRQQRHEPLPQQDQLKKVPPGPISSMFMSSPPSAFDKHAKKSNRPVVKRYSQRRMARVPPAFNLMVVGGKGTGKSSLIRLLLETADISPTSTLEQRTAFNNFVQASMKPTREIESAKIEISESRYDRIMLSVVDTPGLDFGNGRELVLERQVSDVLRHVDARYGETMHEESKVIRKSKGDQHIHLIIYLIDPASISTAAERRRKPSLTSNTETNISVSATSDLISEHDSGVEECDDQDESPLSLSPMDLKIIHRLSARCNVLPIIGQADTLTDERLAEIKHAVRSSMTQAGLDFGVFEPSSSAKKQEPAKQTTVTIDDSSKDDPSTSHEQHDEDDDERQSRTVIKLRPSRHSNDSNRRSLSRSRSRRDINLATDDIIPPDEQDVYSLTNVRFSGDIVSKTSTEQLLPFAVIAPEKHATRASAVPPSGPTETPVLSPSSPKSPEEYPLPETPVAENSPQLPYRSAPPESLKGVFVRKFRWGTIDVLDPAHCDFSAMRTAILSTHFSMLKLRTREDLYERYRTEKLLVRRATRNISDDDRRRIFKDLGF